MKLIETHAHIYLKEFAEDLPEVIERSQEAGITRVYMPNIDETTIDAMLDVAQAYPGYCVPMMGLHPCSVKKDVEKQLYLVEDWISKGGFCAVGEIGTDLYWDDTFWEQQQEAFKVQTELARKYKLPIAVHCRETIDETIAMVTELNYGKGVFHCFTGTNEQANKLTNLGFNLGIGGVATFKNGGLLPVIEHVSLEHIVLETDSPYLAPVPYRGKRNEPSYITLVAQKIAEIKHIEIEEVAAATTQTALNIFSNA